MNSLSDPRTHCLSSLVFDRLLAGEQTGLDGARRHVEDCESCRDHLLALKSERDDALPPEAVAAGVDAIISALEEKKGAGGVVSLSRYKMALWGGIAMAAAASLVLILNITELGGVNPNPMGSEGATQGDGIRIKGSSSFQVLVVHEGKGRILSPKDTVDSGDVLAFRVSVSRAQYVSLAGIGDHAPTVSMIAAHDELVTAIDTALKRLQEVFDNDLASFNTQAAGAGLEAVRVTVLK